MSMSISRVVTGLLAILCTVVVVSRLAFGDTLASAEDAHPNNLDLFLALVLLGLWSAHGLVVIYDRISARLTETEIDLNQQLDQIRRAQLGHRQTQRRQRQQQGDDEEQHSLRSVHYDQGTEGHKGN